MIPITVNGTPRDVDDGLTVASLLSQLGIPEQMALAIERNRSVLPRSTWPEVKVGAGDVFEVVSLVGGG